MARLDEVVLVVQQHVMGRSDPIGKVIFQICEMASARRARQGVSDCDSGCFQKVVKALLLPASSVVAFWRGGEEDSDRNLDLDLVLRHFRSRHQLQESPHAVVDAVGAGGRSASLGIGRGGKTPR